MPMPQQMTICLRTFHYTFMFPKFSYAFAFFFGSLLPVKVFSYPIFLNSSGVKGSVSLTYMFLTNISQPIQIIPRY